MKRTGETIFETLNLRADYAINSKSRSLVHDVYGQSKMALELGAITWGEYLFMNERLVRNTMNNGPLWNTFHV